MHPSSVVTIVPFIAWWPDTIAPGSSSDHIIAFQDFLPTVCDLVGIDNPVRTDGVSYAPTLLDRPDQQQQHDRLYWEFVRMGREIGGRQSVLDVRRNVKAVRFGRFDPVRLYDLAADPGETRDLAADHPDLARQLGEHLDTCRTPSDLWPIEMHDRGWRPPSE